MKKISSLIMSATTISMLLSGCAEHAQLSPNDFNLTIDKNSPFIQQEQLRSAMAILIKKSDGYDRTLSEIQGIKTMLNSASDDYHQVSIKNDELSTKIGLLSDEVMFLKDFIKTLKKSKEEPIAIIAPIVEVNSSVVNSFIDTSSFPSDFLKADGKVIVKYKTAFTRLSPNMLQSSISTHVQEGDIFTFTAMNKKWYRLKSGLYINKMVVCDSSVCGKEKKQAAINKITSNKRITKLNAKAVIRTKDECANR